MPNATGNVSCIYVYKYILFFFPFARGWVCRGGVCVCAGTLQSSISLLVC